jgi:hypothetical protein
MKKLPNFKRGDTFLLNCLYKNSGAPYDVTNASIRSEIVSVATRERLVALNAVKLDQVTHVGQYYLKADASETRNWGLGDYLMDIEITIDNFVRSTETFSLKVIEDITL